MPGDWCPTCHGSSWVLRSVKKPVRRFKPRWVKNERDEEKGHFEGNVRFRFDAPADQWETVEMDMEEARPCPVCQEGKAQWPITKSS